MSAAGRKQGTVPSAADGQKLRAKATGQESALALLHTPQTAPWVHSTGPCPLLYKQKYNHWRKFPQNVQCSHWAGALSLAFPSSVFFALPYGDHTLF